jgi:CHAT domain-containing protein/Flp pilus assembly protein TadD
VALSGGFRVSCGCVAVASLLSCRATPAPKSADFDAEIVAARDLARREGPRAAIPPLDSIRARAAAAGDRRVEALALGHLGTAYKNLGEYDRALALHGQSLARKRDLGDRSEQAKTLSNIGLVHWSRGRCGDAVANFDEAARIFEELGQTEFLASVLNNRGLCLDSLGRFAESRATYDRALALHRQHGNDQGQSETLANLGGVHLLLGQFRDAEREYKAALAIDERLQSQQGIAADLVNLGSVSLGRGNPQVALDQFARARDIAARAGLGKEEADALRGRSRALANLGRFDEARTELDAALAAYEKAGLATERVDALLAHAWLALDLGDLGSAAKAFADATAAAKAMNYAPGELAGLLGLGQLERRWGRQAEARRVLRDALERATTRGDLVALAEANLALARIDIDHGRAADAGPLIEAAEKAARQADATTIRAEVALARGDAARLLKDFGRAAAEYQEAARLAAPAGDPDLLWRTSFGEGQTLESQGDADSAIHRYLEAVRVIEDVRARLSTSRTRAGFITDKSHVYTALVSLLIKAGRVREAFGVAERLRSAGYHDLLARSVARAGTSTAEAAELLARIELLQRAIRERERAAESDVRATAASFREELRAAEREWLEAVDRIARANPAVAAIRQVPDPDLARLRRRLPPATALVQFVVGDRETSAFVLTGTRLEARSLPVTRAALSARVELLRGLIAQRTGEDWRGPAARLGADLVASLEEAGWLQGVRRLLVVPHAELHYVPFGALTRRSGAAQRLLVEDYAVAMLPTASVIDAPRPRRPPSDLLAMAPQPARLPHSAREVEALGALFRGPRLLVGTSATEQSFKAEASRHQVVHLATHGFFDRANPLFSGLELGRDDEEDGRLQVYEILQLDLGAALVTLSACQTALGSGEVSDVPLGEEFVGLTRAFLSAGAGAVMASLWDVSDQATPALMERFYSEARRRGLSDALADAQRARLLAGGPNAHPFYWAPFVLVGAANRALGSVNE